MIKLLTSKTVYQNPWMSVREDEVEFQNGHKGTYGVVDKSDFALIIPFDGNNFFLVKQYRYPTQQKSTEFPQGKHENDTSISPLDLARAELKEETGLEAGKMEELGFLYEAPGYSSQGFHIFLASQLSQGAQCLDVTEDDLEILKVSISEFEKMVRSGQITDASTISAYGLLRALRVI